MPSENNKFSREKKGEKDLLRYQRKKMTLKWGWIRKKMRSWNTRRKRKMLNKTS